MHLIGFEENLYCDSVKSHRGAMAVLVASSFACISSETSDGSPHDCCTSDGHRVIQGFSGIALTFALLNVQRSRSSPGMEVERKIDIHVSLS